tara:strand:+ start:114 stop:350 length:237 start_codon:yes stop_codon:yes gene_type:complete
MNITPLLSARYQAEQIARDLHAAYWVMGSAPERAEYLFASAKRALAVLQEEMAKAEGDEPAEDEDERGAIDFTTGQPA